MDTITLTFDFPINVSVQIGDIVYFTNSPTANDDTDIKLIGKILNINRSQNTIQAEIGANAERPTLTSFILFTKDNTMNLGSVLGYYAKIQFRNGSTKESEIFSVGSEIFESSK